MELCKAEKAANYLREAQASLNKTIVTLTSRDAEMTTDDRLRHMFLQERMAQLRNRTDDLLAIAGAQSPPASKRHILESLLAISEWLSGFEVGAGCNLRMTEAQEAIRDAVHVICE
jgi:hypothetical protein